MRSAESDPGVFGPTERSKMIETGHVRLICLHRPWRRRDGHDAPAGCPSSGILCSGPFWQITELRPSNKNDVAINFSPAAISMIVARRHHIQIWPDIGTIYFRLHSWLIIRFKSIPFVTFSLAWNWDSWTFICFLKVGLSFRWPFPLLPDLLAFLHSLHFLFLFYKDRANPVTPQSLHASRFNFRPTLFPLPLYAIEPWPSNGLCQLHSSRCNWIPTGSKWIINWMSPNIFDSFDLWH